MTSTLRALLFHAVGFVLGTVWLTLVVTGWALALGLAITVVGVVVFAGLSVAVRWAAGAEAALARGLLDADAGTPAGHRGLALRERLQDAGSWRATGYLLTRFVVGLPVAVVVLSLVVGGLSYVVAPLWYWSLPDGIDMGIFTVDTLPLAFAMVPLGVVVTALGLWLTKASIRPMRRLAEWGLPVVAAAPAAPEPRTDVLHRARLAATIPPGA